MPHWLAETGDALMQGWVKRFDPTYWNIDFPRPMMAAATLKPSGCARSAQRTRAGGLGF